ncbi:MAG: hypothetical protein AMJ62_02385 [Myxococcales bacterium SG8_38]|nr:MAG: hypothetical protein AMJ62_02385 [Myxococcales bacterium SG8_38]
MKAIGRIAFALWALSVTIPTAAEADGGDDIKNCYQVRGEARYGALAYKHIVIVSNRCDITLECEVWTDVDPTPRQRLTVGPNSEAEVIIRNNSPARAFKAFGECKKQ